MAMLTLVAILMSVLLSVVAQILLKQGMTNFSQDSENWWAISYSIFTNSFIILGLTCYGLSMVVWLYVLSKVDVSRAYPFVGLGFIGTMLFAHYFLGEVVTLTKIMGTMLVVFGIILLAK
jgi:multidrug transporter EmrE-like cation transporter